MNEGRRSRADFSKRYDVFIRSLRMEILNGQRRAGEMLEPEQELAERYNLSVRSIRKGLQALVDEGLIEKSHGRGSVVILNKRAESDALQVVTYFPMYEFEWLKERLNVFAQANPNVDIRLIRVAVASNYADSLHDLMALERGPDLVILPQTEFARFTNVNELVDLSEESLGVEPGDVYTEVTSSFCRDGRLFAAPLLFSPVALAYNQDLFDEAGVAYPDGTWTWNTLAQTAERLTRRVDGVPDQYGFGLSVRPHRWSAFLMQNEVALAPPSSHLDDRLLETVRFTHGLLYDKQVAPVVGPGDEMAVEALFRAGRIAMTLASYQWLNELRDVNFRWDITVPPRGRTRATILLSSGIGVNPESPNKSTAMKLIRFLLSPEAQKALKERGCALPARRSVCDDGSLIRKGVHPLSYQIYQHMVPYARPLSDLGPKEHLHRLTQSLGIVWSNLMSPDEGCRIALRQLRELDQQPLARASQTG